MRGIILLLTVLTCGVLFAQSADGFREKYGRPISESFAVRDGVGVTAKRGSDGRISEMLIAPISRDSLVRSRNMTFTNELAKRILEELVPFPSRGKFLIGGFIDAICMPENDCAGPSESYEDVSIYYNSAAEAGKLCYIDVRFKR